MVYTLTLNPSLDYMMPVRQLRIGATNRSEGEQIRIGGKGINVSILLRSLGVENLALGIAAGFTGEELLRRMNEEGICHDFLMGGEGFTRINVKLLSEEETEINGSGPVIGEAETQALLRQLLKIHSGDYLVISGSVPRGIPEDFLDRLLGKAIQQGAEIVLDISGPALRQALRYHPFLIKPNQRELEEVLGVSIPNREQALLHGKKLQELGARNVLISLGAGGAVLLDEKGGVHSKKAPDGLLVSSVGAGDSMVAGFLAGWIQSHAYDQAFCMGLAAGSASAFSWDMAKPEDVLRLYQTLI